MLSIALSFLHPSGNPRSIPAANADVLSGAQIPPEVKSIITGKCIDCHSNQTRWPIYSRLFPASWLLERDVMEARAELNFSQWSEYGSDKQGELLSAVGARSRAGSMPPERYLLLHPGSKLSAAESMIIYTWTKTERRRLRSTVEETK